MDHTTVRVEVELAAPVPEGMLGSVHLAWYDPNNTVANRSTPAQSGHGTRDNDEDVVLGTAGDPLPGFTLNFKVKPPKERGPETMDQRLTSYLVVADARYGDNFIVVGHPHEDIEKTYEFRENASQQLVLMYPENTGLWKELPDGKDEFGDIDPTVPDLQTSILTIFPSVDIDCDSDNTATPTSHGIERSDWEERIENEPGYLGKVVGFNEDDDNENGVPDYLEHAGYDYPNGGTWVPFDDDDLVPVVLDRGFEDLSGMDNAEDPSVFFVFELKMTVDRGLKYWLDRQKTSIEGSLYDPDETDAFTEAGHNKLIYRWLVSAGDVNYPPSICVEGIDPAALTDTLIWRMQRVTVAGGDRTYELIHEDTVKMTDPGLKVDLDVDSDNNNALLQPDQSLAEETIEEAAPGKVIESWIGNDFDYDLIPDFADGYDFEEGDATSDKEIHGLTEGFVPMVVTLPPGVDPATAKLKFHYSASDPSKVKTSISTIPETGEQIKLYAPAAGHLRIWKKNVGPGRTLADYVVPDDKWYTASEVCELYVEGIAPGMTWITVTLDPEGDGSGPTDTTDKVSVTVVKLDIDVDSDNNSTENTVDGSLLEDAIEDRSGEGPGEVGKRIFINTDDDNKNGIADWLDTNEAYRGEADRDNDLALVKLSAEGIQGLEGYTLWLGVEGGLKVYADEKKTLLTWGAGGNIPCPDNPRYNPDNDTWYSWTIGGKVAIPTTIYVEGFTTTGERHLQWRFVRPGGWGGVSADVIERDTVEISVEPIVWPSNETGTEWTSKPTSEWNGFTLSDGWWIEKSLEQLINQRETHGSIRTHYPQVKTDKAFGTIYTAAMGQTSHGNEPATTTKEYASGFTMTVTFEFDGPEYVETYQRYVYNETGDKAETASFFRNSGIYIYDAYEVQIYDTDAVLKALHADDFTDYSVRVDGDAPRFIRGNVVDGNVRLYHEVDNEEPKYWYHHKKEGSQWVFKYSQEPVNGCISGVPYKQSSYATLADLEAAATWINGSGTNTMVIVAEPVNPTDPSAGILLSVTLNNQLTWKWEENGIVSETGAGAHPGADWLVYLQSHWGSGVIFTSATIEEKGSQ
jgi:hypothetical protein